MDPVLVALASAEMRRRAPVCASGAPASSGSEPDVDDGEREGDDKGEGFAVKTGPSPDFRRYDYAAGDALLAGEPLGGLCLVSSLRCREKSATKGESFGGLDHGSPFAQLACASRPSSFHSRSTRPDFSRPPQRRRTSSGPPSTRLE